MDRSRLRREIVVRVSGRQLFVTSATDALVGVPNGVRIIIYITAAQDEQRRENGLRIKFEKKLCSGVSDNHSSSKNFSSLSFRIVRQTDN